MPAAPLVTVVIATYNGATTLRPALVSLCAQQFSDFEAHVVGDASTDDSAAVVEAMGDSRLHWTNLRRNSGSQSGPNNEGLRNARGRYVAYLGHDDLWFPWHLAMLVEAIDQQGADLVHGMAAILAPAGVVGVFGEPPPAVSYLHHFVPPSTWLHRREIVDRIGWWTPPEQASCGVDFDYTQRMVAAGRRLTVVRRVSVLKFPSALYRAYAADGIRPQGEFLARMLDDPESLERDVLTGVACVLAKNPTLPGMVLESDIASVRQAARRVIRRRVLDRFGRWWPINRIEHWRFQRIRKALRPSRGLPPD